MKKVFFRGNSPCFTHLLLPFTGKNKYPKVLNREVYGTSMDPIVGCPGDQMMGCSGDVRGTFVIYVL